MKVVPLKAEHVEVLRSMGSLKYLTNRVTPQALKLLELQKHSFTMLSDTEEVLACLGIIEFWEGRGEAWAFFNPSIKERMLPVHKVVKRYLSFVPLRRIEATVDYDFNEGHRWMRLLGFELECRRMEKYNINGQDSSRYVLLKG